MTIKTSTKIIIGVLFFVVLVSIYGYNKAMKLKSIFEKITISPTGFRNLSVALDKITFNVDVEMFNPSEDNFDVSGYVVKLERLNFFYNGKYLATAKPQLSEISIPANNRIRINNIPVVLPTASVVAYAYEFVNFNFNKLTVEAVIGVAGREITIKQ